MNCYLVANIRIFPLTTVTPPLKFVKEGKFNWRARMGKVVMGTEVVMEVVMGTGAWG